MLLAYAGKNSIFGKMKVVARGSLLLAKVKPDFVWFTTLKALSLYKDAQRIVFHYLSYQYGMLASFRNGNSSGCAYENVKKATVIL